MGLELAIARLGTAFALVISPKLVAEKGVGETYSLMETASPAFLGLILMLVGMVLWAIFVAMDARFDRQAGLKDTVETAEEDNFRFRCGEAAEKQAFHRDCSAVRVLLQQCGLIQEIRLVHSDSTI